MTLAHWLSLVIGACSTPCALKPVDNLLKTDREIRIGDVVALDCVDAGRREAIAALTIAVLAPGQSKVELERAAVKALVRRRVPGLALPTELNDTDKLVIAISLPSSQPPVRTCQQARRPIPAGQIIVAGDLESGSCEQALPPALLMFDRTHRVVRAAADIAPGDFLGRLSAPEEAYDASEPVSVAIAIGKVRIERTAEAIQPAIAGQDIFVRDGDGAIFAVPTLPHLDGVN